MSSKSPCDEWSRLRRQQPRSLKTCRTPSTNHNMLHGADHLRSGIGMCFLTGCSSSCDTISTRRYPPSLTWALTKRYCPSKTTHLARALSACFGKLKHDRNGGKGSGTQHSGCTLSQARLLSVQLGLMRSPRRISRQQLNRDRCMHTYIHLVASSP